MPRLSRSWQLARALLPESGGVLALALALALAIAVVAAVAWVNARLERTIVAEGGSWLAGDLQIAAGHPFDARWWAWRAAHPEVTVAESVTTTTLVQTAAGDAQLVALRAIGPGYPLRGQILLYANGAIATDGATQPAPPLAEGQAWIDARLAALLAVKVGDQLGVGHTYVTVAGILARTPEQGADFLSFLPEMVVSLATLESARLLAPGSRATWRWHLAVPPQALAAVKASIAAQLRPGERLVTLDEAQPALQQLLAEVGRFLRLATIAAVLLAAVAVALAARRLAVQMVPRVAVVRALGATNATLWRLLALRLFAVAAIAAAAGLGLGWGAQHLFATLLAQAFHWPALLSAPLSVAWPALLLALVLLVAMVLPWWLWLLQLPPVAVLRQSTPPLYPFGWVGWAILATGGLTAVVVAMAGDWQLALTSLVVMALVATLFGALAAGLLQIAVRFAPDRMPLMLRLPLLFLARRPLAVGVQVAALAVGLTTLWLLLFIRSDLLQAWRYQTPPSAPNRFLLNVMPDQVELLRAEIAAAGLDVPHFWPIVRGRLTAINGAPIPEEILADPRAERLANREFNLTWSERLPEENRIVAGRWHGASSEPEASVEAGLAKRFRLQLGDQVTFAVAGEAITVTITSIRALRWESLNPNFFFITTPAALADAPATYMGALRLPAEAAEQERSWRQRYPNVTVLDVMALRSEFERLASQVVRLLEGLFAFALSLGGVVLLLGWTMGETRRNQQVALLRALGMGDTQLKPLVAIEGLIVGALAAALSLLAALGLGWWLAQALFDLRLSMSSLPQLLAASGAVATATFLMGWLHARTLVARPPFGVLRGAL